MTVQAASDVRGFCSSRGFRATFHIQLPVFLGSHPCLSPEEFCEDCPVGDEICLSLHGNEVCEGIDINRVSVKKDKIWPLS